MKTLNFDEVIVEDRLRSDYGDVEELAESIWRNGLIHPICLAPNNRLIAGGRRLEALLHIGNLKLVTEEPGHSSMIALGHKTLEESVHFFYFDVDPQAIDTLTELELEENVMRKEMSWQERTAPRAIHCTRLSSTLRPKTPSKVAGEPPRPP